MQQAFFDTYAQTYDDHFTNSLIGKVQRTLVHDYLLKIKDSTATILEINGGTGEDALFLAPYFKHITCSDVSGEMLNIAKQKNQKNNNVAFKQSSIQQLKNDLNEKFDIVFSNFGGLNCLTPDEMKQFAKDLNNLSKKDLVFVIMGRKCLWERFIFWWRNDKQRHGRRSSMNGVETELNGEKFKVHYYSPNEIQNIFAASYMKVKCLPIGLFIPPSYLETTMSKRRIFFSVLKIAESLSKRMSFLSNYADHYLIHLKKA